MELDQSHLEDAVVEAKHWFTKNKGVIKTKVVPFVSGQAEYELPEDCEAVIDCSPQVNPLDLSLVFAPNLIADEKIPYDVFAAPQSGGLYSSFVQAFQYAKMAKRVLGGEFNWMLAPEKNKVLFSPIPKNTLSVFVEYKAIIGNIEHLDERDHSYIKRYALAWAKHTLGTLRSKYSQMLGAQGGVQLDGLRLIEESKEEKAALDQEIISTAFPMPFLIG